MATQEQRASPSGHATGFPSDEVIQCPWPYFEQRRHEGPVHELPKQDGVYLITRYDDVVHVSNHPETFSSRSTTFVEGMMRRARLDEVDQFAVMGIVNSDPPLHAANRKLAFEMFKPGKLRGLEGVIRTFTDELGSA